MRPPNLFVFVDNSNTEKKIFFLWVSVVFFVDVNCVNFAVFVVIVFIFILIPYMENIKNIVHIKFLKSICYPKARK